MMVHPTKPDLVKSKTLLAVSYGLAAWTIVMSVAQMVTFEDFVNALRDYQVVGQRGGLALAIVILALQIFSVPFLLRLSLSPLARALSAGLAAITPFVWTFLTISALLNNQDVYNAGYFGGLVQFAVSFGVLVLNIVWIVVVAASFEKLGGHKALRAKLFR